ncbi:GnsA/GnsB family addiction module toxin [Pragia fontium]|uniref:GnsA/GnsB family addiction module toxin n=1 Tax=Pragia fontium TaxID=82985 RepID=UPI000F6EBF7B|nr:GnsA/GnsB family [Pragia fontium]
MNAGEIKEQKERELAEIITQKAKELTSETGLKVFNIEVTQIYPLRVRFIIQ